MNFSISLMPYWFWLVVAGCFGAIIGSYLNMAAYRLPRDISTVTVTRSFCPACKTQLSWYENIPILSYLALLGHCRHCGGRINPRYLIVELLVTGLFILSVYQFIVLNQALFLPYGPEWWRLFAVLFVQLFLIADLVLLSVVDLEMWLIPVETTLPWIILGFVLAALFPELHASATNWTDSRIFNALLDSFTGLIMGAGLVWLVGFGTLVFFFLFYSLTHRNERPKEGMGMGDVHLMGMVGAMLGWKAVLITLFLGIFVGCISGLSKVAYDKFQRWRLGDKYKPWQPTYEVPQEAEAAPPAPRLWLLFVMGVIVLITCGALHEQSTRSFDGQMFHSLEETRAAGRGLPVPFRPAFDLRLLPVAIMFVIGITLIFAVGFLKYLSRRDLLPQGDIVETKEGSKEEVLQGNYIPFGPSLALAALLTVFYDPLLRNFAYWFSNGGSGTVPPPAYHVIGEKWVMDFLVCIGSAFNAFMRHLAG